MVTLRPPQSALQTVYWFLQIEVSLRFSRSIKTLSDLREPELAVKWNLDLIYFVVAQYRVAKWQELN